MTHEQAFELLEEVLNKYIPITPKTNNVKARKAIRAVALRCAWPAGYKIEDLRAEIDE